MGLFYPNQTVVTLVGTKNASTSALTGIVLTASYQTETSTHPTKSWATGDYSRAEFLISYTEGSGESANSIQWKIEGSGDNVNWFQTGNDSTSGGTSTITAREFSFAGADAANAKINAGLDIAYKYMRISFKETGEASNFGNVYCEAIMSGK